MLIFLLFGCVSVVRLFAIVFVSVVCSSVGCGYDAGLFAGWAGLVWLCFVCFAGWLWFVMQLFWRVCDLQVVLL